MPTKVFTTITGPCPFGKNVTIDSTGCRKCEHFYRTGTAMFFWCANTIGSETQIKPKPRVRKTAVCEKCHKRPVNRKKSEKR